MTLILMVLSGFAIAQDSDFKESKTFTPGEFTSVMLEGSFKVYLIQGNHCGIEVKANNSSVFDKIRIRREMNQVSVKIDQSVFEYSRIGLYITFKDLHQLILEGGVNLKTNGFLDLVELVFDVKGGANIDLNMKSKRLEVLGEGGFLFDIKGVSDILDVKISGAGHVSASEFKAQDVIFKVKGFGTGAVYAVKTLDARIEGVGKLRYKGDPDVKQYIDGLGSVKPLE
jgi:hypothetical protein